MLNKAGLLAVNVAALSTFLFGICLTISSLH